MRLELRGWRKSYIERKGNVYLISRNMIAETDPVETR